VRHIHSNTSSRKKVIVICMNEVVKVGLCSGNKKSR